jgi:hypothetical protein
MHLPLLLVFSQTLVTPPPVVLPTPTPVRAPEVVVERVADFGPLTRRVTLFTNRVAVVSVREGERQVFLRRLTLGESEYAAYVVAVGRNLEQIPEGERPPDVAEGSGRGVITTRVGSAAPRRIEYWSLGALDLPLGRLVAVLDDLSLRVRESNPAEEELRQWEPAVGDVVEVVTGERATVVEVRDDGVIVLDLERSPLREEVSPEGWIQRIRRLVETPR